MRNCGGFANWRMVVHVWRLKGRVSRKSEQGSRKLGEKIIGRSASFVVRPKNILAMIGRSHGVYCDGWMFLGRRMLLRS